MAVRKKREELGVQAGDKLVIKGTVAFARLDKLVEGEALEKENARRSKLGMMVTKPFRSISIENPEIIQGANTPLANFYAQEVYTSKATGQLTMNVESKSLFPPQFGHIQNGTIVEIEDPMKNPDKGQIVYLMIEAFAVKGYSNLGSTFNAIVYEEGPINFYEGANSLAGFGQALGMPVQALSGQPESTPMEETAPVEEVAPTPFGGQPAATPAPAANPAPANNPFGVQNNTAAQSAPAANPFGGGTGGNSPFA